MRKIFLIVNVRNKIVCMKGKDVLETLIRVKFSFPFSEISSATTIIFVFFEKLIISSKIRAYDAVFVPKNFNENVNSLSSNTIFL